MDQVLEKPSGETDEHHHHEDDVAVAVITPAGIYPDEEEFRRAPDTEIIKIVLDAAAEKLHLTNTSDWVARVHDRTIDIHRTFREEHLGGIVEIHWHKHEGGGGA
jgi:hypothetical protein